MLSQPPHQDDSDSQHSPSTPKSEVKPLFISTTEAQPVQNDPTMKPNSTQQPISHCQQQPVLPSELGQRRHIVISDLACDMGVLKSIKAICSDLFSGYPTSYKRLSTQSREAYISRFSLEYTWAPSDNERMVSTLHALFANRYRANFSNLRIAAQDKFIDYAKGQDLDCALVMPFRPEFASPNIWHDLCLLGKLKHNRIAILGEGEVPVITMGRRSKSRRLGEMETRETQERNSQAEALMARKAELRIEFELLVTMQKGFSIQMSNIFNAMVSMGVFNSGGSSSQNQPSPILEHPQPQPTNVQAATTSATNVQAATTSATNVQAATTSATNVQAATTSATNV
ncbi:unnamed protein product [Cuscuta epithymum]|uniref:Uncharacterized protein n=1 Tax=Cuscuta epithymum TaxID=186058 RepID=A0AAV0FCW0_9ASTE|nr:unnamed protein product [Cuscuta epithymum]